MNVVEEIQAEEWRGCLIYVGAQLGAKQNKHLELFRVTS